MRIIPLSWKTIQSDFMEIDLIFKIGKLSFWLLFFLDKKKSLFEEKFQTNAINSIVIVDVRIFFSFSSQIEFVNQDKELWIKEMNK